MSLRHPSAEIVPIHLGTTGKLIIGTTNATDSTITVSNWYQVWVTYVAGGNCEIAFTNSGGTKPVLGMGNYTNRTDTTTSNLTAIRFTSHPSEGILVTNFFDRILVDDAAIGNNP
jgi:hypothetical protein